MKITISNSFTLKTTDHGHDIVLRVESDLTSDIELAPNGQVSLTCDKDARVHVEAVQAKPTVSGQRGKKPTPRRRDGPESLQTEFVFDTGSIVPKEPSTTMDAASSAAVPDEGYRDDQASTPSTAGCRSGEREGTTEQADSPRRSPDSAITPSRAPQIIVSREKGATVLRIGGIVIREAAGPFTARKP